MPYLVDSDILIDGLAAVPAARKLLTQLAEAGIAISIITVPFLLILVSILAGTGYVTSCSSIEPFSIEAVACLPYQS